MHQNPRYDFLDDDGRSLGLVVLSFTSFVALG